MTTTRKVAIIYPNGRAIDYKTILFARNIVMSLTRLEQFTLAAMQTLMAIEVGGRKMSMGDISERAVKQAQSQIAAIDALVRVDGVASAHNPVMSAMPRDLNESVQPRNL